MRIFMIFLMLSTSVVWAQSKVAQVKMLRGEASLKGGGKLTQDQWVSSGVVIVTAEKSFVRLMFIDKSQMNIGPNSEMKIEQFGGGDAGVIDLVKGKIRSQVSKDYLQQKDKDKSKIFIKTPNAVMGIRGTDFMISTNGINTSAVLFEGEVVFEKMSPSEARGINTDRLEAVVDRGVRIMPGEFSVVDASRPNPTVPTLLNVQQMENLEKNQDFSETAVSDSTKITKSIVPPGLSGVTVANTASVLNNELEQTGVTGASDTSNNVDAGQAKGGGREDDTTTKNGSSDTSLKVAAEAGKGSGREDDTITKNGSSDTSLKVAAEAAKGYVSEDNTKPTAGSLLDVASGVIIAPSKDATFDPNSKTYISDSSAGTVDKSGKFDPPSGIAITEKGEVFVKAGSQIVKLDSLSVVTGKGATLGDVGSVVSKEQPEIVVGNGPAAVGATDVKGPVLKGTVSTAVATTIAQATSTNNFQAPPPPPGGPGPGMVYNPLDGKPRIEPPTLCSTCAYTPGAQNTTGSSRVGVGTTVGDP